MISSKWLIPEKKETIQEKQEKCKCEYKAIETNQTQS